MSTFRRETGGLPPEQQAIRERCFHPTSTAIEFKKEDVEQSIPARFEEQVRKFASKVAITVGDREITYAALNRAANRVAHRILSEGGEGSAPIVLLLEQGISAISALMGALKAGKFYVPLDVTLPPGTIASMILDSEAKLILTDGPNYSLASDLAPSGCQPLNIEGLHPSESDDLNPNIPIFPDNLASNYYTSGSTGEPKGVLLTHRTMLHAIMTITNDIRVTRNDSLSLLHTPSSSAGFRNTFSSLLNGASLHSFNIREEGMANIADWLIQKKITVYHSTPTVFRSWAQMLGDQQKFPQVRCIRTGAEQTGTEDVELFRKYFPRECVLHVGFSSTEAYHVTRFFIGYESDIAGSIPLGYPPDGTEVMILDEDGKQVGVNRVGEIAVKSRYVSVGYWRKPDLTNSVFLPDPEGGEERIYLTGDLGRIAADGCLKFLGRKDFQVKIRGYSVNVAEIEQAMRGIHRVKDVAVVPQASSSSGHQLAAYVVPMAHPAPTIRQMRESLSRIFPDYKIPSYYVFLDSLPLLPGGKVDRRALPELGSGRPELEVPFVAPRTPSEESLAEIWKEVLGLDQVGIHDNFLELGGDSLLAGQVISRVIKTFRVELPLRLLFEAPTVADMAVVIVQHQAKKAEQEDIERLLAELEGISGEEAQRLLGDENESSSLSDV